ncbi:hypothetical protein BN1263180013 [Stenotrophomonas indicatrix]|nr:hypothetical protein BN1263180013 [Stenotrophomonas indicatrix]
MRGVRAGRAVPGVYRLRRVLSGRVNPVAPGHARRAHRCAQVHPPGMARRYRLWFRDDAQGHSRYRSISKTIKRNTRAIAVIGVALSLRPISISGEPTAWR